MPIRITSTIAGFRRAGVVHPSTSTTYPDDRFSAEQLQQLETEPRLVVEHIPSPAPETDSNTHAPGGVAMQSLSAPVGEDNGENLLQPLVDIIQALDPQDKELWNQDDTPKASNFPKGTEAVDRANAWEVFKAQDDGTE